MSAGTSLPWPPIIVQVGFGSTPLATPQTWTDVTKLAKKLRIQRGRTHVFSNFNPGKLTLTLWGVDRSVDPTNTSSPFAPGVDVNKQIQVLVNWNLLTAAAAGASMSSGWAGTNATLSYPSGVLQLSSNASGTMSAQTATGTSGFAVVPGQPYTGMVSFKAATSGRSCSVTLTWYTAAGATISSAAGSTVTDTTSGYTQATVTATSPATAARAALTVTVASTGAASEKHTVQQAGVFPYGGVTQWQAGGPVPLFTGFLDQLDPQWLDNLNTDDQLTATDSMRLLSTDLIVGTYQATVTVDGASDFWPFGDPPTQSGTVAAAAVGSVSGTYVGGYTLGVQGPNYTDPTTAVQMGTSGGEVQIPNLVPVQVFGSWSAEVWFQSSSVPTSASRVIRVLNPSMPLGVYGPEVVVHTNGSLALADATNTERVQATANYCNGVWHHVVVSVGAPSGSTATATLYVDGNLIGSYTGTTWYIGGGNTGLAFGGFELGAPFQTSLAYAAWYGSTTLSAAQVLNHYNQGFTGFPLQDSGARITAVLSALGTLAPPSSIAVGVSNIIQPQGDLTTNSVLSYLQQLETAEAGFLYDTAGGVLTFLNRNASITAPRNAPLTVFGENSGEVPYLGKPDIGIDVTDLSNRSLVSRQTGMLYIQGLAIGGTSSTPQIAQDTTSQAKYAQAATKSETGLLLTTDQECLSRAQWNVTLYAYPKARVRSLTVNPMGDPVNRFPAVLFRELMDRVTVKRRPWDSTSGTFGSPIFQQDEYIEAITHDIDFSKGPTWRVTYAMSPAVTQSFWILGDATYGVLGSTTRCSW